MIILIFVVGENAVNPRPRHFEKRMVDVTLNTWIDQSLCELLRQAQLFIQLANRQRCEQIQVNLKRFPECASVRFLRGDEIENLLSTLPISNKTYTVRNIKAHFTMSKNLSMTENLSPSKQRRLSQYQEEYQQLKEELQQVGHVLQGSLTTRWIECGKESCRCHNDPQSRHGPYYQWSWKNQGKTSSLYLNEEQADLCKEWIENHREL